MKLRKLVFFVLILLSISCSLTSQNFNSFTPPSSPTATLTPLKTETATATAKVIPTTDPSVFVPPACSGQPIATLQPSILLSQPTPGLSPDKAIGQVDQLSIYNILVEQIHRVYLYPDFNGVDWNRLAAQVRLKIIAGLDTNTFYDEMRKLVEGLGDKHSSFESPIEGENSNAQLLGVNHFVGMGVLVNPVPAKGLATVVDIFPDSTAEHSGIKQHDNILAVDGIPLVEKEMIHLERLRGPECSAAVLTIQSPGAQTRKITLLRYQVNTFEPIVSHLITAPDGSRIGYLFLPTFFDDTIPNQVKTALQNFGKLDGLILDNRMNTGGASNVVEDILAYFTSGTVGHFISRTAKTPFIIKPNPINNSQNVPMVVLVGPDTASFGEIFSGILQDLGRARVVGQTTRGIVEILHGYNFSDGSQAWIAQERFEPLHSHVNWENKGITPDKVIGGDWDTFNFDNDPGVAAALKSLNH